MEEEEVGNIIGDIDMEVDEVSCERRLTRIAALKKLASLRDLGLRAELNLEGGRAKRRSPQIGGKDDAYASREHNSDFIKGTILS